LPPVITFEATITNSTATLDPNSVQLTLDGRTVVPVVTAAANETTVTYPVSDLLPPGSDHRFVLTYSDTAQPPNTLNNHISFSVVNYTNIQLPLAQGNFLFGNAGYRNGSSQVLFLETADFDLAGKTNIHLSFHSLYEQNQDSFGSVEYSINQGQTWLPILYLIDGPDLVRGNGGEIDAAATLHLEHDDTATWSEPPGVPRGGNHGDLIGVEPSLWSTLAPYLSARVDDNPVESKRVEFFRLPEADDQSQVRFRFAYCGTDSWYFGVDNFGLYSISAETEPARIDSVALNDGNIVLDWTGGNPPFQVQRTTSLTSVEWQDAGPTTADRTFTEPATGEAAFYRIVGL
jgi:hypothetical protein